LCAAIDKLILHCCINGSRRKEQNPAIPYTPAEIAREARRAVEAGASIVHVHARNPDGSVSRDAAMYAEIEKAFRAECDAILNFTAGRRAGMPLEAVTSYLAGVPKPPDMITLNFGPIHYAGLQDGEPVEDVIPMALADVIELLELCYARGIVPEPAILDMSWVSTAAWLAAQGKLRSTRYFMIEFAQRPGSVPLQHMPASARGLRFMLDFVEDCFPGSMKLAHGYEDSTYEIAAQAIAAADGLRIGLEDCLAMPDGALARSNAEQIAWAVARARSHGREPATPAEARSALMGLPA
jgi:3-keto-5-aminohexanoate cleavage enzyme